MCFDRWEESNTTYVNWVAKEFVFDTPENYRSESSVRFMERNCKTMKKWVTKPKGGHTGWRRGNAKEGVNVDLEALAKVGACCFKF